MDIYNDTAKGQCSKCGPTEHTWINDPDAQLEEKELDLILTSAHRKGYLTATEVMDATNKEAETLIRLLYRLLDNA